MPLNYDRSHRSSEPILGPIIKKYGPVPSDYVDFIAKYNGIVPPDNLVSGTDGKMSVRKFFSSTDIIDVASRVDYFPQRFLPFAEDFSGNIFCLDPRDGKVFFWEHEMETFELIANSFTIFLDRLTPFDISSVRLDWTKVKKVWVNPNFKPKF